MASRGKCLVIEDDEDTSGLIGVILTGQGFDVHFAETGAEALLIASGSALSLITLDLGLPDMDGRAVARRLRHVTAVPILMITAYAQAEDELNGIASGASAYLIKPFHPVQLRAIVQNICPDPEITRLSTPTSKLAPTERPDRGTL